MTTDDAPHPLMVLIAAENGMADRILSEHADDGTNRCKVCSSGAQTGRYGWPCALYRAATAALQPPG